MLSSTRLFQMLDYSFWPKGSPLSDFLLRETPERIVLFLLFICLFQKTLIANIWASYTKVHDSKVESVGYISCNELIITLVCHCYCHYKAEGNYTVRILCKCNYKPIPGTFRKCMGLEKFQILNSAFQVSVEIYRNYHQNLVRRNRQKSKTVLGTLPFFSWFHKATNSKIPGSRSTACSLYWLQFKTEQMANIPKNTWTYKCIEFTEF